MDNLHESLGQPHLPSVTQQSLFPSFIHFSYLKQSIIIKKIYILWRILNTSRHNLQSLSYIKKFPSIDIPFWTRIISHVDQLEYYRSYLTIQIFHLSWKLTYSLLVTLHTCCLMKTTALNIVAKLSHHCILLISLISINWFNSQPTPAKLI